jgi:hypothetical protein
MKMAHVKVMTRTVSSKAFLTMKTLFYRVYNAQPIYGKVLMGWARKLTIISQKINTK